MRLRSGSKVGSGIARGILAVLAVTLLGPGTSHALHVTGGEATSADASLYGGPAPCSALTFDGGVADPVRDVCGSFGAARSATSSDIAVSLYPVLDLGAADGNDDMAAIEWQRFVVVDADGWFTAAYPSGGLFQSNGDTAVSASTNAVRESNSAVLTGIGLVGLTFYGRRRRLPLS